MKRLIFPCLVMFFLTFFTSVFLITDDYQEKVFWEKIFNIDNEYDIQLIIKDCKKYTVKNNEFYSFDENNSCGIAKINNIDNYKILYIGCDDIRFSYVDLYHIFDNWYVFNSSALVPSQIRERKPKPDIIFNAKII